MISLTVNGCRIDILPIVRGLSSYGDAVTEAFGKYDRYSVSLSQEEIIGVRNRKEIVDEYEPGELESVFAHRLREFGKVSLPAPAWCNVVDLCDESSKEIIALDMSDEQYTAVYCDTVSPFEYVSEHHLAKKGMKRKFDMSTPETFSISWDAYVNKKKGFRELSNIRERYIALRLSELSKDGGSLLAVIDCERTDNIAKLMG